MQYWEPALLKHICMVCIFNKDKVISIIIQLLIT